MANNSSDYMALVERMGELLAPALAQDWPEIPIDRAEGRLPAHCRRPQDYGFYGRFCGYQPGPQPPVCRAGRDRADEEDCATPPLAWWSLNRSCAWRTSCAR